MTKRGEVDAMLCGTVGRYEGKLHHVVDVLGLDPGVSAPAAMSAVLNDKGVFFFVDTHVQYEPSAEQIAESALAAAYRLKLFGIEPRIALVSHSHFGARNNPRAVRSRQALALIHGRAPELSPDGESHIDAPMAGAIRARLLTDCHTRQRE